MEPGLRDCRSSQRVLNGTSIFAGMPSRFQSHGALSRRLPAEGDLLAALSGFGRGEGPHDRPAARGCGPAYRGSGFGPVAVTSC